MGKYSSDSDNDRRSNKTSKNKSHRSRSSSSDSSDSRKNRRLGKKSYRRSRSKDRYSRSRRSRSSSYSKSKTRRSTSRERSKYRRSSSREKYRRSKSRDRYRSRRSRSKSFIREYVSKPKRRSSSDSSHSSDDRQRSRNDLRDKFGTDKLKTKLKSSIPSKASKTSDDSTDCVLVDSKTLNDINEDKFVPRQFYSGKSNKVLDNIVIDLNKQTIKVPDVEQAEPDSIFHNGLFSSAEVRLDKWIRELYSYRQKALQQKWKNE